MRGLFPENTLPGFQAAIDAGVDSIECDILATSDEILVVHHDYTIGASGTSMPLLIRSLTLKEIKRYDCGAANPEFPQQKNIPNTTVPTLEELLDLISPSSVRLNLEIKRDARHPDWTLEPHVLAQKVLDSVKSKKLEGRIYYSSFDVEVLRAIRNIDATAAIGLIFGSWDIFEIPEKILECARTLRVMVFSPKDSYLKNRDQVKSLQKMGFRVIPWTVNNPSRWAELIGIGVDGIITDYPKSLLEYLSKQHGRQI
jgi:glycerophosphoryl diester phosphodiesterase